MKFRKPGLPSDNELVLCTIKKILPHSIFVDLDEYEDKEGYIHISEIAPGRIRNIRDHVREGRKIVCKVLSINREKGHIDLSLRRVSEQAKLNKLVEFKQEEKAEKILEKIAKKTNSSLEDVYNKIIDKAVEKYGLIYNFLQDTSLNGDEAFKGFQLPKEFSEAILEVAKDSIKQQEVSISYTLSLSSQEPNGITIIKKSLLAVLEHAKSKGYAANIKYISAPRYMMTVKSGNYKSCEKIGEELGEMVIASIKNNGQASIEKIEK